jgi:hypothetical protein
MVIDLIKILPSQKFIAIFEIVNQRFKFFTEIILTNTLNQKKMIF